MKDLVSNIGVVTALASAVQSAAINGEVINRKGFESVTFIAQAGAIASAGDFTFKLQHSDTTTSGDFVDVPAEYVVGTIPATLAANTAVKVGYVGHKQYTRIAVLKTGGTSIALGATAVLGHAHKRPVA